MNFIVASDAARFSFFSASILADFYVLQNYNFVCKHRERIEHVLRALKSLRR